MTDRRFSLRPVDGNVLKTETMNQEVKEEVLLVNDGIRSTVRFVIIKKTQYQLLLGLPWLKEVNPKIDWRKQTASLLMTQIENVSKPNKKNGEWLVAWKEEVTKKEEALPKEFQMYAGIFEDKWDDSALPEHKPWDHAIELKEGEEPKAFPMYKLSPEQQKLLMNYIDEHLKKGLIRESKSSAGYPVLFSPKPDGDLRMCIDY